MHPSRLEQKSLPALVGFAVLHGSALDYGELAHRWGFARNTELASALIGAFKREVLRTIMPSVGLRTARFFPYAISGCRMRI